MKWLLLTLVLALPASLQAQQTAFESVPGPLANCPKPAAGQDLLCDVTNTGWMQSTNGGAYTPFNQPGTTPTIKIGTVATLTAGSNATVTIDPASTTTTVVLDFGIPVGLTGGVGTPGAAATITLAPVTVLPVGATPTVVNSGTANAAVLNFGLPTSGFGSLNCATYSLTPMGLKAGPGCVETNP